MASEATKIPFVEGSAPSTPSASRVVIYAKSDGLMYSKDDAGAETLMSAGASGNVATDAIWDAAGDLAVGSGANTAAKLTLGSSGQKLKSNGTTAVWGNDVVPPVFSRRNGANYTLNNVGSWVAVDATNLNLTVAAATGDILQISVLGRYGNEAVNAFMDVASIVSASPVNWISGGTGAAGDFGVAGWLGLSGVAQAFGGPAFYTVQSGDISGGNVVLRLMYRTSGASKTLNAGTSQKDAMFFGVVNFRQ